jgi:hypothetical protein
MSFCRTQAANALAFGSRLRSTTKCGLSPAMQRSTVCSVPPVGSPRLRISVPSECRTFMAVRIG